MSGSNGRGYHGIFFEIGAAHVTIENSRVYDNTGVVPMDSHAEIKGSGRNDATRPSHITIRNTEIFQSGPKPGGNFQGIDCNRCDDWVISGNHILNINQPSGRVYSYYDHGACIQMKPRSQRTIIERNRVERCHIGIVYGGEGAESPEYVDGIVRNNLILDSENIGLVVANVTGGKVYNNALQGNYRDMLLGSDRRHPTMINDVDVANNIFSITPEELVFKEALLRNNIVLTSEDSAATFADLDGGDYQLQSGSEAVIDKSADLSGDVSDDYYGAERPLGSGFDLGTFEQTPEELPHGSTE